MLLIFRILKIAAYVLTILIQLLLILTLKFLDHFILILFIFIFSLFYGYRMSRNDTSESTTKAMGWGLLYGSITLLGLIIVFIIWLSFNFPK